MTETYFPCVVGLKFEFTQVGTQSEVLIGDTPNKNGVR